MRNFLHPSWHFYTFLIGSLVGTIGLSFLMQPLLTGPLWLLLALGLILLALFTPCRATLPLALLAGLLTASVRFSPLLTDRLAFAAMAGQTLTLTATIAEDPDLSEQGITLRLRDPELAGRSFTGLLYVKLSSADYDLMRSDRITLTGKLSDGFGTFIGTFYRPTITAVVRDQPGDIFAYLKQCFSNLVKANLPAPESDLGLGYLMGQKNGLSTEFSDQLRAVGMTHIVVASGAHLGILIELVRKIFGRLSRFAETLFATLAVLFFASLVGFTPSMTRAALVVLLGLYLNYVGRSLAPWRLLILVATLTLYLNPMNFQNLGWQLSFASFVGILVLAPLLTQFFYGGKTVPWLANMLITSLSTTLICAPVMLYNFGSLSLLSFVANLIILPTLPYAMALVFLTGASNFLPLLPTLFATLAQWLLNLHIFIVEFLSLQDTFILNFSSGSPWWFLLYLPICGIIYTICVLQRKTISAPSLSPSQKISPSPPP